MTIADLHLPPALAAQYPPHMGVRVESRPGGRVIAAYQHSDCTGGRWHLGVAPAGEPSAAQIRAAVIYCHREPSPTDRY